MSELDLAPLIEWLSIDATSGREAAALEAIEAELVRDGLRATRQAVSSDRWNLLLEPSGPMEIALCTHVDTVPPWFGPTRDGDSIRARGACDTRGGLFAMWHAWRALPDPERSRTGFLLLVGEEVDHAGAIAASSLPFPHLRAFIVGEPTCNRLASGQKGILKGVLRTTGRAGHSAFPDAGSSAIHELVACLHRLLGAPWPIDPKLGETTLNIGVIRGGVAANVFAPEASAEILLRASAPVAALRELIEVRLHRSSSLEVTSWSEPQRLLHWPGYDSAPVPFHTDIPYLTHIAPAVLCGPGDIRIAHSPDERISLPEIQEGIALYRDLVAGILSGRLPLPASSGARAGSERSTS